MPTEAVSEARRIAGQAGAYARLATLSPDQRRQSTAAARAALQRKFEDMVDPERVLDPIDRMQRAAYARRAALAQMSLKGIAARRQRRAERAQAAAEAELDEILAAGGAA